MYHIPIGVEIHKYTMSVKERQKGNSYSSNISGYNMINSTIDSYFTQEDVMSVSNGPSGFWFFILPKEASLWTYILVAKNSVNKI